MGQKWGKPYANLCHSMPFMHLCNHLHARIKASNHGPLPQISPTYPYTIGVWEDRSEVFLLIG